MGLQSWLHKSWLWAAGPGVKAGRRRGGDLKAVETTLFVLLQFALTLVEASSRTHSTGPVGPGVQGLLVCLFCEWLGRSWLSKGSQLNLPRPGERLPKSLPRDPFWGVGGRGGWGREKFAVAALLLAASPLNKLTTFQTETFAHLLSPDFLEMFVH